MARSKGNQLLAEVFHAIMDQIEADRLKLQRREIGNEFSHIKHIFSEIF